MNFPGFDRLSSARKLRGVITGVLERIHKDESGATLTEFVIMLPIFVLIFNGVMIMGEYTRKGAESPIRAYKETFNQATQFQKSAFAVGWSMQSTSGAANAGTQMTSGGSPAHNRSGAVKATAIATEGFAYGGLASNGHMGESQMRADAVGTVIDVKGCEGFKPGASDDCYVLDGNGNEDRLTGNIQDLVGGSEFAESLLDDSVDFSGFDGEGGLLNALNDAIDAVGARPALAAGIRYGTVTGRHEETFEFAGQSMEMNAYFNTLIPPSTTGGSEGPRLDALRATGVTRMTMEDQGHYHDLLGISDNQRLDEASFDVPDYP